MNFRWKHFSMIILYEILSPQDAVFLLCMRPCLSLRNLNGTLSVLVLRHVPLTKNLCLKWSLTSV